MNINCKKELSNINGTLEYLETPYKYPARNPKGLPHTVFLWPNKPLIMHETPGQGRHFMFCT